MHTIEEHINKQLEFNRGKNLFFENRNQLMGFVPITSDLIQKIKDLDKEAEILLLDSLTDKVIQEFCTVNQYYSIDEKARNNLKDIYSALLNNLKADLTGPDNNPIEAISNAHFNNLKSWLKASNPFAEAIYPAQVKFVEPVACAEYSPEIQVGLLQVDLLNIKSPVLDIGCGKEGKLVSYLRQQGVEAYGIDRFEPKKLFLKKSNWLEYDYEINKWGTVISHLGFSNHFEHHNQRNDGNFIEYAKKYMDILRSLKVGGAFYYAPDLPFIEQYLERKEYLLATMDIGNLNYKSAKVTRLK